MHILRPVLCCDRYFVLEGVRVQNTLSSEISSESAETRTFVFSAEIQSKRSILTYLLKKVCLSYARVRNTVNSS